MKECALLAASVGLALALSGTAWAASPPDAAQADGGLELPLIFSDGAVLQRDRPLPVWGQATPGATVSVRLGGQQAQAVADAQGRWRVQLPAHAAGGPYVLEIDAGPARRRIQDLLFGEVWLASGQSNMEWPVKQALQPDVVIAAANDAQLRHYKVPRSWAEAPRDQLEGGQWLSATPANVGDFSAIGYTFAQQLRQTLKVPIGIIDSTWGGSSIEAWMDASMLGLDAQALQAKMAQQRAADAKIEEQVRQKVAIWTPIEAASEALAADVLDETGWASIKVPASWESQGYAGMDGHAWYRTRFELSAAEAAAGVTLGLGQIDDTDVAWVNGQRVGGVSNGYNVARVYKVPASVLRAGANTLAVRVQDDGGGGGIMGAGSELFVRAEGGQSRSLAGAWMFRTAQVRVSLQDDKNQVDTLLYNAMLHPLAPYPIAGVIWYQGETNASPEGAYRYRDQFQKLIQGWRQLWASPELPFLWSQLAPFHSGGDRLDASGTVIDSAWANLRESQSAALALPATGQVVITDVGDTHDIHPRDKHTVGQRLAWAARRIAYGDSSAAASGPVFRKARESGQSLVLEFDSDGATLTSAGGALQGFEVAGADGRYFPAQARIEGGAVVVSSPQVTRPVQARYGWSDDPKHANLSGRDGLLAAPFRTSSK